MHLCECLQRNHLFQQPEPITESIQEQLLHSPNALRLKMAMAISLPA